MSGRRSSFLPDSAQTQQIYSLLRSHAPSPSHIASNSIARSLSDELERLAQDIARLRDSEELATAEEDHAILAEHCSNVRSLLSPIHRLPSELLADIFVAYAALDDGEQFMEDRAEWMEHRAQRALEALAQEPLLVLSRVCSRWYGLVMNTPTLWSTIELNSPELWTHRHAMLLLNRALERSANAPLTLEVFTLRGVNCPQLLKLLGQHSNRWRSAFFFCSFDDFHHLRDIKENLPLLETLMVQLTDEFDDAEASHLVELFTEVPRLRSLSVGMLHVPTLVQIHLDKVEELHLLSQDARYAPGAVASMAMLPAKVKFQLLLFISNWADHNITPGINAPATSSYIEAFAIGMHDYFEAAHCVKALTDVLDALTLPELLHFGFRSEDAPNSLMSWAHTPFLDLAMRSSFQNHLQSLFISYVFISYVVITEPQLLQVSSVLPLLQTLAISDHVTTEGNQYGADQLLITDSLLAALTLDAGAQRRSLVPLLCDFEFRSTLQFKDDVFYVFLSSRCRDRSTSCVARLYWIQDHGRALDPSVVTRIRDLCVHEELSWEFSASE
ncbi:hypothetical protein R3P38DRAFT_928142 [Favolaschia claudopus]|uniref:F-box domain-containing protein n=1 Tax=Favolaschia claudopus TaxID=2862362 RepID=A0AAW0BQP0_9AGAR